MCYSNRVSNLFTRKQLESFNYAQQNNTEKTIFNRSIQILMENQSFSTWNGDELIDILINARIPFDSTRRTDTEYLREHVSQMFVDPNQSDCNPEHISMNVRLLHEQHRDDVNKLHEILGSLMGAVEDLEIQEWEYFVNGMKQELATLDNELRQHDCSLMFIGDTGAGKSTLINILVGQDVLPTGMLKTTGAVIELRHADKWSFSVMESCGTSDFIDQPMDFDHFLDKPSMAFKAFGLNESSCWPFVRVRLEYPLPLLSSGIVIYDSPGLKDTDELTEAVVQNMRTCQAFIHVLNRGLTAASTQMLERLLALGRKPASIFFAITHMEDYSSDKKTDTINKLRNDLEAIDADFNSSEIVILEARRAFDVLIRYQLYTKECADFLCRISPFFCRILSFKYHSFSERLGNAFRRLSSFVETNRYRAEVTLKDCEKQELLSKERATHFDHERQRLKLKFHEVLVDLLRKSSEAIVAELHTADFYSRFQAAVLRIPFKGNLEGEYLSNQKSGEARVTRDRDLYKLYLHSEFEGCVRKELQPRLNQLANDDIGKLSRMFCNDLGLVPDERDRFFDQLKTRHLRKILELLERILRNMLESLRRPLSNFKDVLLDHYLVGTPSITTSLFDVIFDRNAQALAKESRWQDFRHRLAKKYRASVLKLIEPDAIERYHRDLSYQSLFFTETMGVLEEIYVGTSEQQFANNTRMNEATSLLTFCDDYLGDPIAPLSAAWNSVQATTLDLWSLTPDMIHPLGRTSETFNDESMTVFKARLKRTSTSRGIKVYVRRLSRDYCAKHLCAQTRSSDVLRHPNILHCFGAYHDKSYVHVVTERWKMSLEAASNQDEGFCLKHRLRIAAELTEMCLQMTPIIPIEQLKPTNLLIGRDDYVKVNLLAYKPSPVGQCDGRVYEIQRQKLLNQALGVVFQCLFTHINEFGAISQSLCSLANRLCNEADSSDQYQALPLMHILHTLKVEQINLQYSHTIPRHLSSKQRKPRGLLAIDGGGSRGVVAARILQQLERVIGKPLWEMFDFGGGVSTGGLLILSSLVRRTPSDKLVQMYKDMCGKIFAPRLTRLSEYSAKPLERELKNHFSDLRMVRPNGKGPHVFVVTKRNYDPEPYLLRNYPVPDDLDGYRGETGWLCSDAARATTAANTFFTPHRRDDNHYSDGAMGFDNPTQLLFNEVLSLLSKSTENDSAEHRSMPRIDYIVSIGTGKMDGWETPVGAPKTGLPRVLETVQLAVELLTDFENTHLEMQMLTKAYGNIPYFRFNPLLPERLPLDMRTEPQLDMLVGLTESYLGDVASGIPKQIDRLSELVNMR